MSEPSKGAMELARTLLNAHSNYDDLTNPTCAEALADAAREIDAALAGIVAFADTGHFALWGTGTALQDDLEGYAEAVKHWTPQE